MFCETDPDTSCFMLCSVQVKELQNPDDVFDIILGLIIRLAEHGLIHCDFNEFNIMVSLFFFPCLC
jgi:RIO kinase 2